MGIHPRKLFFPFLGSRNVTMMRGTSCSPIPSPLHSPIPLPLSFPWVSATNDVDDVDQNSFLQMTVIVVAFALGIVILLLTMSVILRYYYSRRYYHLRRNTPILFDVQGDSPFSDDEGPATGPMWFMPTMGLQQSAIDSITVCKYRKDEGLIEGTVCPVCLGDFHEEESLRLLPKCSHAFHVPCIDTWLMSHKNCPLCRAPIVHHTGGSELVRTSESGPGFSDQNEDTQLENLGAQNSDDDSCILSSEDRGNNGIPDKILVNSDKMNCYSPIDSVFSAQEFDEEIVLQSMRGLVSLDSSTASEVESLDTNLDDDKKVSTNKDGDIAKHGGESSTSIYKLASIGDALDKSHFSFRRSSSHNRNFIFSTLCRSQSSTLPM